MVIASCEVTDAHLGSPRTTTLPPEFNGRNVLAVPCKIKD